MSNKKILVIHSGGMDSTLCLALALQDFDKSDILSLSFDYKQRHHNEIIQAKKICNDWGVDHETIPLLCLQKITDNALMNTNAEIQHKKNSEPNTLVVGRNGLMARLGAIYAQTLSANYIYMGTMELENSNYRDCSREYMDKIQEVLRMDLDNPNFEIRTPLSNMTKKDTLKLAIKIGILDYLLENTITCYSGIKHPGCQTCPACVLKNRALNEVLTD
jgi:7-cyano-7-deazaguanine synthase